MKKHLFYIDVIRVFACLSVVMIHTSAGYAVREFGTLDYYIGHILDSLSRTGVPLFVMISGALFLDENYEISKEKLMNHIFRLTIFYVSWCVLYMFAYDIIIPLISHKPISIKSIIVSLANGHLHLWFVPMIIGLYLITPLLRLWIKKDNQEFVRYFLILSFVFTFLIPQAIDVTKVFYEKISNLKLFNNINMKYVGGYVSYFVLGWYLNNYKIENKKRILILGTCGILATIGGGIILSYLMNKTIYNPVYSNFSVNVLTYAVMIFSVLKDKYEEYSKKNLFTKSIYFISSNSLGIYAIHIMALTIGSYIVNLLGSFSCLTTILFKYIIAIGISLLVTIVMKKIPLISNIV